MSIARLHNRTQLRRRRRELRAGMTPAEATLWRCLQCSRLDGRKFRRQHSIGPYIVDFYCPAEKLIVELDGAAHDADSGADRDAKRDRFLDEAGLEVVRIENRHVFANLEGVLSLIRQRFRRG